MTAKRKDSSSDRGIYRSLVKSSDLTGFHIRDGESDLYISTDYPARSRARKALRAGREQIENYLSLYPDFGRSLLPRTAERGSPSLIEKMAAAAFKCGVGPMAAVAGSLADWVGESLAVSSSNVIVENGGDIYLTSDRGRLISLYAGEENPFTGKMGIKIKKTDSSLGIAASSRTIGPSLNWGRSDLTVVLAETCALADAAATALSNWIYRREKTVWEDAINRINKIPGIKGGLIIMGDQLQAWGRIELVKVSGSLSNQGGKSNGP